ncbi:MAG TPA: subclass B3 metallo-beta-lactamase [Myxococcales bacterium]|jgi:metallo-beta-lactamase class B
MAMLLGLALLFALDVSPSTMGRPVPPFHIAGNLYYVGHNEISAFLFATPQGLILIDGGFEASAPQILSNVQQLGFKPEDVKILLNTQAHFDHAGALAELKRATGAKLVALQADAQELANGGPDDGTPRIPPVDTDVVVKDGGQVELGGTTLIAHLTPGHTKGCTTFTTSIEGKSAVFVCSTTAPGYKLVGNAAYPNIVDNFRSTFNILRELPCDYFFASHGSFFDLDRKRRRLIGAKHGGASGGGANPFIDPSGYQAFLTKTETAFERQLAQQKQVSKDPEKR